MTKREKHARSQQLKAAMATAGMSQADLSKALDTSAGVVSRWMAGQRMPSMAMALRLEALLGLPHLMWFAESAPHAKSA